MLALRASKGRSGLTVEKNLVFVVPAVVSNREGIVSKRVFLDTITRFVRDHSKNGNWSSSSPKVSIEKTSFEEQD